MIRAATKQDVDSFYGGTMGHTMRAWAVDLDGELVAIAGVIRQPLVMIAFSSMKQGLDVGKLTIWKTALQLWGHIMALGYPVRAIAHPDIPGSGAFLERLGFDFMQNSPAGEVYQWARK